MPAHFAHGQEDSRHERRPIERIMTNSQCLPWTTEDNLLMCDQSPGTHGVHSNSINDRSARAHDTHLDHGCSLGAETLRAVEWPDDSKGGGLLEQITCHRDNVSHRHRINLRQQVIQRQQRIIM